MSARFANVLLAIATVVVLTGLTLFPPWATPVAGNGYPNVNYRWLFSPPENIGRLEYRVDVMRLQTRWFWVVSASATLLVAMHLWRKRGRELKHLSCEDACKGTEG